MLEETNLAFTPGEEVSGVGQLPFCPEPGITLAGAVAAGSLALLEATHRGR